MIKCSVCSQNNRMSRRGACLQPILHERSALFYFFQHATQLVGSLKVFVILGLLPTWKFLEHVITAIAFITSYFCCRLFLYLLQVVNIYLIDFVLIWQHDGLLSTNSLYAFDNDGLVFLNSKLGISKEKSRSPEAYSRWGLKGAKYAHRSYLVVELRTRRQTL